MERWRDGRARLLLPVALLLPWAHSSLACRSLGILVAVSCEHLPSSVGRGVTWELVLKARPRDADLVFVGGVGARVLHSQRLLRHTLELSVEGTVRCGQKRYPRSEEAITAAIVGGKPVNIAEFPWQVGIFHKGKHLCGGAILNEWWVLSAAHCFRRVNTSNLEVIHGIDNLNTKNLKKEKVHKLILHPFYDAWLLDNDIALLLLTSPLYLGITRIPICLTEVTDMKKWSSCWVAGWGVTNSVKPTSPKLQKVNLQLVEWEECYHILPLVTRNMLCAGSPEVGKDSCQGDSGGPLVCHKKKNRARWYQIGIVSWGLLDCGRKNIPGVYTKVSNYLLWINQVTTQAGKPYAHEPDSGRRLLLSPWAILFLSSVLLFWPG